MEKREETKQEPIMKNPMVQTGIKILGFAVVVGGVAYLSHKAGVEAGIDQGVKMAVNTCPPCEEAVVIARDCLAQNPEVAQNLFYTVGEKKDLLVDILKGLSNKAHIYLERLGDVIPEGMELHEVPGHVTTFK